MKGRNLKDMTHKPMYQISFYYTPVPPEEGYTVVLPLSVPRYSGGIISEH
jgi:hypothetical protein